MKRGVTILVEHEGKFLLNQRLLGMRYENYWQCPGGTIEEGESPQDAAVRELFEEAGLVRNPKGWIPFWRGYQEKPSGEVYEAWIYWTQLNQVDPEQPQNCEPHKHSDWEWFTPEEALCLTLFASVRKGIELAQLRMGTY